MDPQAEQSAAEPEPASEVPAEDTAAAAAAPDQVMDDEDTELEASEGESEGDSEGAAFTWQASEYVFHDKSSSWYMALWAGVLVGSVGLGFFHQWFSIAVVIAMALAITTYSRKQPRTLTYSLGSEGITIEGKLEPFAHFKSYSVHQEVGWAEVDLEPARRFSPRLTLLCDKDNFDQIEAIMAAHLPRVDREHDFVERASRNLKF